MNNTTSTPVIEQLDVEQVSVDLSVAMKLAGVQVLIGGTYNVHSNCYYPSTVREYVNEIEGYELMAQDLDAYCENMGWDYYDTSSEIQKAVENRDR